jgi:hypothetical protein
VVEVAGDGGCECGEEEEVRELFNILWLNFGLVGYFIFCMIWMGVR